MKKILFIHQSAELYGSDKTLLLLLQNLDKNQFFPVVVLPNDGPLKKELERTNIKVEVLPVLKLYRGLLKPKNILAFLKDLRISLQKSRILHNEYKFDLVYSNTLAVLLGILYAWKNKTPHIWHVHEIIERPIIFKKVFINFLSFKQNKKLIFNSIATQKFWSINKKIDKNGVVVWNGIENGLKIDEDKIRLFRKDFFNSNSDNIVIGLVGRISRWKGQMLLLEAFKKLSLDFSKIKLVFVGDAPPKQEYYREKLIKKIKEYKLGENVLVVSFQEDIKTVWEAIDIAVVPSTEPEPFGMVAIEAMDASKPVVGANHGGLKEIIIHNETGFLFEPSNENELIETLEKLILNQNLRTDLGRKGKMRVNEFFTDKSYSNKIEEIILGSISF